jgi:hypothetical protein
MSARGDSASRLSERGPVPGAAAQYVVADPTTEIAELRRRLAGLDIERSCCRNASQT